MGVSAFHLRSKINKKAPPGQSKIKHKIDEHLDPIFDRFLIQLGSIFGRILASKLKPSWDQMPLGPDPKTNQKKDCVLEGLRTDLGWILASNLGAKTLPKWSREFDETHFLPHLAPTWPNLASTWPNLVPTWPQLGPTWPQLGAKMAPKTPTWSQDGPQDLELGAKMAPKTPNLEPRWPPRPPIWSQNGPQDPQLRAKPSAPPSVHMPLTIGLARRNARSD